MNIEVNTLENREVEIIVHVDDEKVENAKQVTARKLSKNMRIPGFRPGKAPYHILRRYFSDEGLLQESLEELAQEAYRTALEKESIVPAVPGNLTDANVQERPIRFTYKVALSPEVDLGDYRSIQFPYELPEISESDLDAEIEKLRKEHSVIAEVSRPVEAGDLVTLAYKSYLDGDDEAWEEENDVELTVEENAENEPAPGFAIALIGAEPNSETTINLSYPEDFINKSLAGQPVKFVVTVQGVKGRSLPALDDDFAATVSADYATIDDLRDDLREQLQNHREQSYNGEFQNKVFQAMRDQAKIVYSSLLVDHEIEHQLEHFDERLKSSRLSREDYYRMTGKNEEEHHNELREQAENTVKSNAVVDSFVKAEKISIDDAELLESYGTRLRGMGIDISDVEAEGFRSREILNYFATDLLNQKLNERLLAIGSGKAPAIEMLAQLANALSEAVGAEPEEEDEAPVAADEADA
ncbi:MAG TPA: trigger factor [Anaerolineales bacterium]|nr:trigger factor [Anaerolineales bacterium]